MILFASLHEKVLRVLVNILKNKHYNAINSLYVNVFYFAGMDNVWFYPLNILINYQYAYKGRKRSSGKDPSLPQERPGAVEYDAVSIWWENDLTTAHAQ